MYIGIDTALNNMGASVMDADRMVLKACKLEPENLRFGERIHLQSGNVLALVADCYHNQCAMLAMEDYPLTCRATSYRTAELIGAIKVGCIALQVPYCMVHVGKTKKYVVKKKEVEKSESIAFADKYAILKPGESGVLTDCVRSQKDKSDIAEAWIINQIGFLVKICMDHDPMYLKWTPGQARKVIEAKGVEVEERWLEILADGPTGILNKPGLVYHPQREQMNG